VARSQDGGSSPNDLFGDPTPRKGYGKEPLYQAGEGIGGIRHDDLRATQFPDLSADHECSGLGLQGDWDEPFSGHKDKIFRSGLFQARETGDHRVGTPDEFPPTGSLEFNELESP